MSAQGSPAGPDDLTLVLGSNRKLSGWQDVRVTRGIERCPNTFQVTMTELFPGQTNSLVIEPQDTCKVYIGTDLVLTGYVDRFIPSIEKGTHSITVAGRSMSEDMVDCAAEYPTSAISISSAYEIAKKLAAPYGITVNADVDTGAPIPIFYLTLGETAYAIVERVARYRGLLIYDLPDGSITLTRAGSGAMTTGVVEGLNIQKATATYAADQRFSDYDVFAMSIYLLTDLGNANNLKQTTPDPGVKRHRLMDIISEGGAQGLNVAKLRGLWEAARRAGRANTLNITVDSWRNGSNALWTPNYSIPVTAPSLKTPAYDWVIAEVTYIKNAEEGTVAELTIMPKNAFLPEPILLLNFPAEFS